MDSGRALHSLLCPAPLHNKQPVKQRTVIANGLSAASPHNKQSGKPVTHISAASIRLVVPLPAKQGGCRKQEDKAKTYGSASETTGRQQEARYKIRSLCASPSAKLTMPR